MAKLTATTITNAYMAAQQRILIKLNSLAHEYLADPDVRPVEDRKDYLIAVIDLLREHLGVRGASIFYQDDLLFPKYAAWQLQGLASLRQQPSHPTSGSLSSTSQAKALQENVS